MVLDCVLSSPWDRMLILSRLTVATYPVGKIHAEPDMRSATVRQKASCCWFTRHLGLVIVATETSKSRAAIVCSRESRVSGETGGVGIVGRSSATF